MQHHQVVHALLITNQEYQANVSVQALVLEVLEPIVGPKVESSRHFRMVVLFQIHLEIAFAIQLTTVLKCYLLKMGLASVELQATEHLEQITVGGLDLLEVQVLDFLLVVL